MADDRRQESSISPQSDTSGPSASPSSPKDAPRPFSTTPPSQPKAKPAAGKKKSQPEVKDAAREVVETIVFVVVLVLLLKTFLAEAFVIPTGSMATTLLGYHRQVTCDACGRPFLINASSEAEGNGNGLSRVLAGYCPNCQKKNYVGDPDPLQPPGGAIP